MTADNQPDSKQVTGELQNSLRHMALLAWKNGDITMIELKALLDKREATAKAQSRIDTVYNLIWHHSIAEYAEDGLIKQMEKEQAELTDSDKLTAGKAEGES